MASPAQTIPTSLSPPSAATSSTPRANTPRPMPPSVGSSAMPTASSPRRSSGMRRLPVATPASSSLFGYYNSPPSWGRIQSRPPPTAVSAASPRLGSSTGKILKDSRFSETNAVSFTWIINELSLLRDEVENSAAPGGGELARSVSAGAGKSEVWTTQPLLDSGRWKLELVRTNREGTTVLSVYLTSLAFETATEAAIMVGLRSGDWIWRHFDGWVFTEEAEFYECHTLPSLSELLRNPLVAKQDAVELTIQITTGALHTNVIPNEGNMPSEVIFQQPNTHYVSKSILASLERLLDCPKTGDVRVVCRERSLQEGIPVFRDRILWAHSSVLSTRSSYFATMLDSNFSEGCSDGTTHANAHTLRVTDADFNTTYWLLRFLYIGEIDFDDDAELRDDLPTADVFLHEWTRADAIPATTGDPTDLHPHPSPRSHPASALAIYKLAHRYGQQELQELSKRHIFNSLTPQNAFQIFLATSLYPDVHSGIRNYLHYHWEQVSATEEFEQCVDEVSVGEWGIEAGRSLRTLMKSLISPFGKARE